MKLRRGFLLLSFSLLFLSTNLLAFQIEDSVKCIERKGSDPKSFTIARVTQVTEGEISEVEIEGRRFSIPNDAYELSTPDASTYCQRTGSEVRSEVLALSKVLREMENVPLTLSYYRRNEKLDLWMDLEGLRYTSVRFPGIGRIKFYQ